jgi:hypothetical protein
MVTHAAIKAYRYSITPKECKTLCLERNANARTAEHFGISLGTVWNALQSMPHEPRPEAAEKAAFIQRLRAGKCDVPLICSLTLLRRARVYQIPAVAVPDPITPRHVEAAYDIFIGLQITYLTNPEPRLVHNATKKVFKMSWTDAAALFFAPRGFLQANAAKIRSAFTSKPSYIREAHDNGPDADYRYTIIYEHGAVALMHPGKLHMWAGDAEDYERRGETIPYFTVPESIRLHIINMGGPEKS